MNQQYSTQNYNAEEEPITLFFSVENDEIFRVEDNSNHDNDHTHQQVHHHNLGGEHSDLIVIGGHLSPSEDVAEGEISCDTEALVASEGDPSPKRKRGRPRKDSGLTVVQPKKTRKYDHPDTEDKTVKNAKVAKRNRDLAKTKKLEMEAEIIALKELNRSQQNRIDLLEFENQEITLKHNTLKVENDNFKKRFRTLQNALQGVQGQDEAGGAESDSNSHYDNCFDDIESLLDLNSFNSEGQEDGNDNDKATELINSTETGSLDLPELHPIVGLDNILI